ncbi:MAG: hypothetical protein ACM3ZE_00245 [Myxococcales bacterium]
MLVHGNYHRWSTLLVALPLVSSGCGSSCSSSGSVVESDLRDMFTSQPDFTPYEIAPVPLASKPNHLWKQLTKGIDFTRRDVNEELLQRAIRISEGLPRPRGRDRKTAG